MPHWLVIVVIVFVLLAIAGIIVRTRQLKRSRPAFDRSLEQVNRDLATAAAADRGWDRATLEEASRPASCSSRCATARAPTRIRPSSAAAASTSRSAAATASGSTSR